ncbi:MAG TPA: VIT1/CCC1 transporter family protein [Acidimicrobiales bacterium]|nr:VIT1/CCC1 transporter family protein [Acidimicrobiales bacterium]
MTALRGVPKLRLAKAWSMLPSWRRLGSGTLSRRLNSSGPPAELHQEMEHHHRNVQGGAARAAVFGVSDGLVTNVSLILGVAGAQPGPSYVRLAGIAGLLAGAFSMAAGEYVSMSAQRDLLARELDVERQALSEAPEAEREELALLYEERGMPSQVAAYLAHEMMKTPEMALEAHAREELGIHPGSMGSPYTAAASSLASFAVGAAIPLAPWLFVWGYPATAASLVLVAVAAVGIGFLLARATGRSPLRSVARQLVVSLVAAGITYLVGWLVGVGVVH